MKPKMHTFAYRLLAIAALVLAVLMLAGVPSVASARAGTLVSCDAITTFNGMKWVGTYCVDFECQYVTRRMFDQYCPFTLK